MIAHVRAIIADVVLCRFWEDAAYLYICRDDGRRWQAAGWGSATQWHGWDGRIGQERPKVFEFEVLLDSFFQASSLLLATVLL